MDFYFFDSSAVVKRYVFETGSTWVRSLFSGTGGFCLANITAVEFTSAVVRRTKGGTIQPALTSAALSKFRFDWTNGFLVLEVTPMLVANAEALAEKHFLRAYDAIQLSTLLELNNQRKAFGISSLTLISADAELNSAATKEGFTVDDPNTHP